MTTSSMAKSPNEVRNGLSPIQLHSLAPIWLLLLLALLDSRFLDLLFGRMRPVESTEALRPLGLLLRFGASREGERRSLEGRRELLRRGMLRRGLLRRGLRLRGLRLRGLRLRGLRLRFRPSREGERRSLEGRRSFERRRSRLEAADGECDSPRSLDLDLDLDLARSRDLPRICSDERRPLPPLSGDRHRRSPRAPPPSRRGGGGGGGGSA